MIFSTNALAIARCQVDAKPSSVYGFPSRVVKTCGQPSGRSSARRRRTKSSIPAVIVTLSTRTEPPCCFARISRMRPSSSSICGSVRRMNSMRREPAIAANSAIKPMTWRCGPCVFNHARNAANVSGSGASVRGRSRLRFTCLHGFTSMSPRSTATVIRLESSATSRFARTGAAARSTRR
ncbi:hypothetical protein FQZ97_1019520 [compost metagenome]